MKDLELLLDILSSIAFDPDVLPGTRGLLKLKDTLGLRDLLNSLLHFGEEAL